MGISVTETALYVKDATMRMPFHFGNVHVYDCPRIVLELEADFSGFRERGRSMGAIVPMWFIKRPDMSLKEGTEDLLSVMKRACDFAEELPEQESVFECWHHLARRQAEWGASSRYPALLAQYGVSIVEQALIDAHCRNESIPFTSAVRENTLGIDLAAIHPELDGHEPHEYLPLHPLERVAVRHTVGLTDPLTEDDITPEKRVDDGLPQSLEACIAQQGVDHFKIKIGATVDTDRKRLRAIAAVIEEYHDEYVFTLDANEQYGRIATFREQWKQLTEDPELEAFFEHLLYVEQPLDRSHAFGDDTRAALSEWEDHPPVIIDESDDTLESLPNALDHGYSGTSHKNCKGVFKGIANRCLLEHRRAHDDGEYRMSAEDLTTIGPIEVQQDLAVVATLGLEHVERNGHHYLRGLSMFDESLQEAVLDAHSDLYRRHEDGYATLDISDGALHLGSVVDAPFGYEPTFDVTDVTPIEEWSPG